MSHQLSNERPLTSGRDGYTWYCYTLMRDESYYDYWARNLVQAEITGYNTYMAMIKVFESPLERWSGANMQSYIYHATLIANQERGHSKIVGSRLNVPVPEPVDHEKTVSELDLNERRSLMRLTTIADHSSDENLLALANRLLVDEAYHCWFTALVLKELGDFDLPRLT